MLPLKKLAIVTSHPIQYNAPLFQLLAKRGHIRIKVFYSWGKHAIESKFDPGFGKVIKWDIPLLDGYEYEFLENVSSEKGSHHFKGIVNPDILKQIDSFDPDSILVFGWAFQSHLKVLRHYHNKKRILFRGDSTLLRRSSAIKEKARTLFLTWVYKHIDIALYVGQRNLSYFKKYGLKNNQLVFAPHAIDNDRFSDNKEKNESEAMELRRQMGINPGSIVFLYAGKLEKIKDIRNLLLAFIISGADHKSELLIVGNGDLEKELKEEFGHNASIYFMDFQNQMKMPTVYRMADIFILPSISETWGLSVNEAMACGLPIIVSERVGCAPDLIREGKNGVIFKAEDIHDLGEKLAWMCKDKSTLKNMGNISQEIISDFTFQKVSEAIEHSVLINYY